MQWAIKTTVQIPESGTGHIFEKSRIQVYLNKLQLPSCANILETFNYTANEG